MVEDKTKLLDKAQTMQKIRRISYEILEHNLKETEVIFAGIVDQGYVLADLLMKEFNAISDIPTKLVKVELDKDKPLESEISLDCEVEYFKNKAIILVDDVMNKGTTLIYSFKPFLTQEINKLQTAVLVNRGYKRFPVSTDYYGYALSTSLKEHIHVELKDEETFGVYLS